MQEETNGKNKAPVQDIDYENKTQGTNDLFSKDLYLQYLIQELILVEEQEPRKKGAETKSHISPLSHNKWSLLGVIVLIVAVLYPFKMFYE